MSLFPAYSDEVVCGNIEPEKIPNHTITSATSTTSWLANVSYITEGISPPKRENIDSCNSRNTETPPPLPEERKRSRSKERKQKHKHKKEKKSKKAKKHKKRDGSPPASPPQPISEFTGTESYYVDKTPGKRPIVKKQQRALNYKVNAWIKNDLPRKEFKRTLPKLKRYYLETIDKSSSSTNAGPSKKVQKLSEAEFTAQTKEFNKNLLSQISQNIPMWLDFVELQNRFYMRLNKIQLAERKLDILDKAIRANIGDDRLYDKYIEILQDNFPEFEVIHYLDSLIMKDPANYTLWNAQLMTHQCSMAMCNVTDMLGLYGSCMQDLYKANRRDEDTLRIFNSCSLFLRQAGLNEKFFALLTLALDLNYGSNKFGEIKIDANEQTLVEYEELILESGLPMNELWLRIENLRQNFYFQPCKPNETTDLYRVVTNKDICEFIYPLAKQESIQNLVLIILRLLKVPLPNSYPVRSAVFTKCDISGRDNYCDFDSIEEIASFFLQRTILKPNKNFDDILWSMLREFCIGPSYITTLIGHEMYIKYLNEILLTCADCYAIDDTETLPLRDVFITLLVRLEHIVILFDVFMNKWTEEKDKKYRSKMKGIIRNETNRNCTSFYVEYAKIEYDLNRMESAQKIFMATLSQINPVNDMGRYAMAEYWMTAISFVEMLMAEHQIDKCLKVLTALALDHKIAEIDTIEISEMNLSLASNNLLRRVNISCLNDLANCHELNALEYLQPNYLLFVIKAYLYHIVLWRKDKHAMLEQCKSILATFSENNTRDKFFRESIYEILVNLLQYKFVANGSVAAINDIEIDLQPTIKEALLEYPANMPLLQYAVVSELQPWYQIRSLILSTKSPIALIFLAAGVQLRYQKYSMALLSPNQMSANDLEHIFAISASVEDLEKAYKIRAVNIFCQAIGQNEITKKCSLLWRFYLKSLIETQQTQNCREIVLKGLNECPWNKALYLEAFIHVSEEQLHLQDLIIEKNMRLHAIPEELEILRNQDVVLETMN